MIAAIFEILAASIFPVPVVPVLPAVMRVDRITAATAGVVGKRCEKSPVTVSRFVIVAKVVMTIARPQKEVIRKNGDTDHRGRGIIIIRLQIHRAPEMDRGEQNAAPGHRIVPIAIHINTAAARPAIIGRYPDPIFPDGSPIPGPPSVTVVAVAPVAWNPTMIARGGLDVRPDLHAAGRLGQVGNLRGFRVLPVTGRPLVLAIRIRPITWHPLPARRQIPPNSADPQKVVLLLIPRPVAGNPGDVVTFQLLLRRHLLDRGWRLDFHQNTRLGIVRNRPGEGLMNRPPGQNLDARRIAVLLSHRDARTEHHPADCQCGETP